MSGERSPREVVRTMRSDAQRNKDVLIRAATTAIHREGLRVPLGTMAADAGLGIGTLYRHFPTRTDLLIQLTHQSFEQVLVNAHDADRLDATPTESLRRFVEATIAKRNELVLPLHVGTPLITPATRAVRCEVHRVVQRILDRGHADGSLKDHLIAGDVIVFGTMLAQPHPPDPAWDTTCRRLLASYLDGLARRPAPAPR